MTEHEPGYAGSTMRDSGSLIDIWYQLHDSPALEERKMCGGFTSRRGIERQLGATSQPLVQHISLHISIYTTDFVGESFSFAIGKWACANMQGNTRADHRLPSFGPRYATLPV